MSFRDSDYEISDPSALCSNPRASVLVLAYNHAAYIRQALDSVLDQATSFEFEVLIGEDGSSDGTAELVRAYQQAHPSLIRVISAGRNVGLYENWRRLLRAARGACIAHLDGDDFWLPNKLQRQVDILDSHPCYAAVYTNAVVVDESGGEIGIFNDAGDRHIDLKELLRSGNFLNLSSMVFRASCRDSLMEVDRVFIDYRVHLRLARVGPLLHLSDVMSAYRSNSSGSMVTRSNALVRQCYWEAIMDVPRDLVSNDDIAAGLANFMRRVAFRALRTRDPRLWTQWWSRILQAAPFGSVRMIWLLIGECLGASSAEIAGWLSVSVRGRARVFYRSSAK